MEKGTKKSKKGFLITEIILLILIIGCVGGCVFLINEINGYKRLEKEYKNDSKKFGSVLKGKEAELKEVEAEVEIYKQSFYHSYQT